MAYRIHTADTQGAGDDGQRPCARGDRCLNSTAVQQPDGSWRREPALGYRAFCDACRGLVLRSVEQMPGYHADLRAQLGERYTPNGPKVTGTSSPARPPLNLAFDALAREVYYVASSWAGRVVLVAGLHTADVDRGGYAYVDDPLQRMCETLAVHVDVLLGLEIEPMTRFMGNVDADEIADEPFVHRVQRNFHTDVAAVLLDLDGADAGLELLRLNGRCRWMLGLTGADVDVPVPCWSCDQRGTVVRPDGSAGLADFALCRACGEHYYADRFTRLMAEVYEREIARQQAKEAC